ncbi:class I SAM-dependent methyltransferase [Petropleomorpha daqingensis]|uniref:Ubiquinone/menaquinone biosynthesis C-methylase UbiE n=1 Tax=Petropleomorpha daqingensis TaxID=2026353 RepID=A0A853CHB8_9ACTN|nr:class I SAM-dependent methyltransferase [Petropleomorpha daqingensis]NYJ06656.1 ubiquinone/menaquinone biosynthesis C-methylase UbiE [Petropleomorpha daqingensis]
MQPGAHGYVFGSAEPDPELARLAALGEVYGRATEEWLDAAGLEPGMTVVDLGCGPGGVTLAVADRVGPTGRVIGIDTVDRPLRLARHRAAEAGLTHVTFERADITTWRPAGQLDAVVGRFILVHIDDPVAQVALAADLVRPGGVVAFLDVALCTRAAQPELPLLTTYNRWLLETFRRVGRPVDMALRLAAAYTAAGLSRVTLTSAAPAERGGDAVGLGLAGGDVTSLLPLMERVGVTTADEVGPETFERRLRAQAAERDAVLLNPLVVGASARTPVRRAPVPPPRRGQG